MGHIPARSRLSGDWLKDAPAPHSDYDVYSRVYDAEYDDLAFDQDFWLGFLDDSGKVVELGCGSGRITRILPRRAAAVVGIDSSPEMLQKARERVPPGVELREGDLRSIPADAGEFDVALCIHGSFAYLPSPVDQLAAAVELARIVKPGGLVVIDVPFYPLGDPTASGPRAISWTHRARAGDLSYDFYWQSDIDRVWNLCEITQIVDATRSNGASEGSRLFIGHRTKIYTVNELVFLLIAADFMVTDVFGGYDGRPWGSSAERLIVVGRRA